MKNIALSIILIALTLSTTAYSFSNTDLINIQQRIEQAMSDSFKENASDALNGILLELAEAENAKNQHWVEYWTAYALYHRAIFESYGLKDNDAAKSSIDDLITMYDEIENKNSEDYALMAHVQGFSLQWVSGLSIIGESGKAEMWGELAIDLGPENPRAFYVLGNYDFHKPAFVGGGKKAKGLLEKSLTLYKKSVPNPFLPSWGMGDTYAALAEVYLKEEALEDAKKLINEGLSKYPDHRNLNSLQNKIKS